MDKIIKIYNSFDEQEQDDIKYWKNLSGKRKLEILEIIRGNYWAIKNETSPRFQRIFRIIKRT
jgi:hypothetical protein